MGPEAKSPALSVVIRKVTCCSSPSSGGGPGEMDLGDGLLGVRALDYRDLSLGLLTADQHLQIAHGVRSFAGTI